MFIFNIKQIFNKYLTKWNSCCFFEAPCYHFNMSGGGGTVYLQEHFIHLLLEILKAI